MADIDLYRQLAERHGHYCPMSTLGLRLGLELVRRLRADAAGSWQLTYRARTCAADGIALALEASSVPAELQVEPLGQHLLLCVAVDGRELSLGLSAEALQLAAGYRELAADAQPGRLELMRSMAVELLIDSRVGVAD